MFNVEKAVADWRARLQANKSLGAAEIAELESHLRDSIDALESAGLALDEAFLTATIRLGETDTLVAEFNKNKVQTDPLPVFNNNQYAGQDHYPYAGFSRRLMALLFDACTCVLANLLLLTVVTRAVDGTGNSDAWAVFAAVMLKLVFASYFLVSTYTWGGTFGKIVAGIRICRPDGSALSPAQTVLRSTPYLLLALLELILIVLILDGQLTVGGSAVPMLLLPGTALLAGCWLLASALMLVRDKYSRTLHDHLAGTIVVDESFARISASRPMQYRTTDSVWA